MASLPLRLESSFEQWWFVAPIDWAAANGHTEVVKELLRMDPSLFHNLTSKKRMRRLEKLWDDQDAFSDAAIGRSKVVKDLLQELDIDQTPPKNKASSPHDGVHFHYTHEQHKEHGLFKAGYGVWVLYIAAAAGDEGLVNQMITTNPELIKGDGEFGLSDLLYAAARGQNIHIFQQILTLAKRVKVGHINGKSEESSPVDVIDRSNSNDIDYVGLSCNNRTIQSKALLAAARAGNAEMVRELLKDSSTHATVLSFRDSNGTTALHAAAGRGHLEVVKLILELCPSSIHGQDAKGNTALHTAARRGCLKVATEIMRFDKELIYTRNKHGETPLHLAVMGSKQPPPKLILKQGGRIDVVNQLISCNNNSVPDYINWKTNEGHTPLHLSVMSAKIDDKLVALLLQSPGINVLETNNQGSTALDLARACRETYPAAEFRCNIAISLLGAAVSSGPPAAAGRPSTGPGSAAISVDLADPLMCSFSHDMVIASDGESRTSEQRRNLARHSVSVDWATDFQTAPAMSSADAICDQPLEKLTLPDEKTLSRNLAALRQNSAAIFESREGTNIGSPSPIQCFSTLHSLFSGSTFRHTTTSDQAWASAVQSKKWNNFRQRTSKQDGSPQSLRQQFSSTDNILFHPNTPMETAEVRQAPAPSISVSPFASPAGSTDHSPTSPSYIKSWLKSAIEKNHSPGSSSFPSPSMSSKRQRIKRRIKQLASLTHFSFSSASETHSINDQADSADLHLRDLSVVDHNVGWNILHTHGSEIDNVALHMDDKLSIASRQSSVQSYMACRQRCFCVDHLFQSTQNSMAPRLKEGQTAVRTVVTEAAPAPSLDTDAQLANDFISTQSSGFPRALESSSPVNPIITSEKHDHPQVPKAAVARTGGSSPMVSPRPSATLSLSPWLSPTLRSRLPSLPRTTSSLSDPDGGRALNDDASASPIATRPLPLGSPVHEGPLQRSYTRQESFSLCPCGPCFQEPAATTYSSKRARVNVYHT